MKGFSIFVLSLSLIACSHGNCRDQQLQRVPVGKEDAPTSSNQPKPAGLKDGPPAAADRVRVYKPDGSQQCNQGQAVPTAEMQKQLAPIEVYGSANKHDGLMRAQVCGNSTGRCNVYEIARKDLEAAQKKGFKEWTAE